LKYCVSEIQYDENLKNNAAVKARDDVTRILSHMGMKRITLSDMKRDTPNHLRKLAEHVKIAARWKRAFGKLQEGDILYIQFPPVLHTVFYAQCVKSLQKRGVKVVLLIHDLEILRWKKKKNATFAEKLRFDIEEKTVLLAADGIIAHNEKMKVLLTELGIDSKKIVCLGIFDYLIPDFRKRNAKSRRRRKTGPVLIAGNLARHKAGYVYDLPSDVSFELFGTNFDGTVTGNITYRGSQPPEELPFLLEGSFGLVWDGDSTATCSGVYGEYLSFNNPHKTSLFLASEIPVIIWEKAALADFVRENHCGITVSSLEEIRKAVDSMTDEEYDGLCRGAEHIGRLLRCGTMTRAAADAILTRW
jgi:hypothetical protein